MTPHRVIPLVLVAMMAAMEAYASHQQRRDAQYRDSGSLYVIYLLIGGGFGTAFSMWGSGHPPGPQLANWALWAGAVIAISGMALRVWSIWTLGRYFTYVVRVSPDQKVVENGPYRVVRHPSYSGGLLTGIGIGLSMAFALAPLIIGAAMLAGYLIRIGVEEHALAEGLGEPYRSYMNRTKRLIPFVW